MSSARTLTHQHQSRPVDPRELRRVCGLFVTGVTVITSGADGRVDGTTVNSFTSVSLEPPLVLFCLHNQSRLHEPLRESGRFAVNFLAGRHESLAQAFAGRSSDAARHVVHHGTGAVPVLSEAMAFLSCRTVESHPGGDHTIVVGEVMEMGVHPQEDDPLIFFGGVLGTLGAEDGRFTRSEDGATASAPGRAS